MERSGWPRVRCKEKEKEREAKARAREREREAASRAFPLRNCCARAKRNKCHSQRRATPFYRRCWRKLSAPEQHQSFNCMFEKDERRNKAARRKRDEKRGTAGGKKLQRYGEWGEKKRMLLAGVCKRVRAISTARLSLAI